MDLNTEYTLIPNTIVLYRLYDRQTVTSHYVVYNVPKLQLFLLGGADITIDIGHLTDNAKKVKVEIDEFIKPYLYNRQQQHSIKDQL